MDMKDDLTNYPSGLFMLVSLWRIRIDKKRIYSTIFYIPTMITMDRYTIDMAEFAYNNERDSARKAVLIKIARSSLAL